MIFDRWAHFVFPFFFINPIECYTLMIISEEWGGAEKLYFILFKKKVQSEMKISREKRMDTHKCEMSERSV